MTDDDLKKEIARMTARVKKLEKTAKPTVLEAERRHLRSLIREQGKAQRARFRDKGKDVVEESGFDRELALYFDGDTPHEDILAHAEWNTAGYWQEAPGFQWNFEAKQWVQA